MNTMATLIFSVINLFVNLYHYLRNKIFFFPSLDKLWVMDMRNFWLYSIPIHHNAVRATDFQKIAPLGTGTNYRERVAKGLVVLDPGFKNTAVGESQIVYMYLRVPKT